MGAVLSTWITFFIVSVAAGRLGFIFPKIGLPLITGYLVIGSIAGPYVLGLIKTSDIDPLSYVTQFALAFIAFSAGAELYLPEIRSLFKPIIFQTTSIAIVTFSLCTAAIYGLGSSPLVPFMNDLDPGCRLSVSSIAASIMVARSPASAIAIVKELKAKGVFVSTLLGITVLCDVYVLLGFTLTTTIAESECSGEGFSMTALGVMVGTLFGSVLIGYIIGKILIGIMMAKRVPWLRYAILPLGFLMFLGANKLTDYSHDALPVVINLEPLLMGIVAGFVCTNQSKPYVFLPFFTLTGASLNLQVMVQSIGFAIVLALIRGTCIFLGSASGGWLAGQSKQHNMFMWMTLLTQAGVSLGLASEVGMSFPGWGRAFQTAIIAEVLVNQVVGPIFFKIAVRRTGEAGKGATDDAWDQDAAVPTAIILGTVPTSHSSDSAKLEMDSEGLLLARRLLREHWAVIYVAPNETQAAAARNAVKALADAEMEAYAAGASTPAASASTAASAAAAASDSASAVSQPLESMRKGIAALQRGAAAMAYGQMQEEGAGSAGTPKPGAGTPAASASSASGHGHGGHDHEAPRRLDEHFTATALLPDSTPDAENPFLDGAEVNSAAAGSLLPPLAAVSTPKLLSPAGSDGPLAPSASPSGPEDAIGRGTDFRYAAVVAAMQRSGTLRAVAVLLPSDAATYAACRVVRSTILRATGGGGAGADRASSGGNKALRNVRVLARVLDPAWGEVATAMGVAPLHAASITALAASRVVGAALAPGKPVGLLKAAPVAKGVGSGPDAFTVAASKELVAPLSAWGLFQGMALPASPGTGATVAPTFGEAPGHTQTSSAEALELAKKLWAESAHPGRGADDARSAEADGSSGVQRSSSGRAASKRGLGLGLGVLAKVDEVPMWQRDAYLADLQTLSDDRALDQTRGRVREVDEMTMYGSVSTGLGRGPSSGGESGEAGDHLHDDHLEAASAASDTGGTADEGEAEAGDLPVAAPSSSATAPGLKRRAGSSGQTDHVGWA